MFSISNVRAQIRTIRRDAEAGNTTAAVTVLETLALDIIQADIPLYIVKKEQDTYIAPVDKDDPRTFMRVFTHECVANSYLEHVAGGTVEKISVIESLQLSKFLFCRGVYGMVLNDGDEWAAISLSDYVGIFCRRVLRQEASVSQSYINCVQLITAVQKNSLYQLSYLVCDGQPEIVIDGSPCCYILDQDGEPPVQDRIVRVPLTLQDLFKFHSRIVVSSRYLMFTLEDHTELYEVLEAYHVKRQEVKQVSGFYDAPGCRSTGKMDYHNIQDLSLVLPSRTPYRKEPSGQCTALVLVPAGGRCDEEADNQYEAKKKARNSTNAPYKRKWRRWGEQNSRGGPLGTSNRTRWIIGFGAGIVALLIVLSLGGKLFDKVMDRRSYTQFEKALSDCNYAQAYQLYSRDGRKEYDDLLGKEIDLLISQYAHNRIDTAELKAALQAISHFPSQAASLANAQATVERLEVSKESFAKGLKSEDAILKLSYWIKVIPLDKEHYDAVQSEVNQNSEEWSTALLSGIERYAYADRQTSCQYIEIGQSMFPEEEAFRVWADRFADELARPPLSNYPIHIKEIDVCKGSNNTVTVYIKWKNESTRAFQSVDFYFVFLDAAGERVTYQRRGEEKSIFQGVDSKAAPYEPGFEIISDTWGWAEVWKGHGEKIEQVKLTCVKVHYMNGGVDTFSLQQDLDAILNRVSVS